ncbi:MAG: outer membrane beta-barrel protein [Bacteroidetes bacterium]|nr:outer membrane beta-barrel protein [Bacteroidota bacterium]
MLLSSAGFAQDFLKKGNIYCGLGFGVYSGKTESESKAGNVIVKDDPVKRINFDIMPEVNYFLINNFSIGLMVGINTNKVTSSSTLGQTKTEQTIKGKGPSFGANARKYFSFSKNFHTFVGLGLELESNKEENKEVVTNGNTSVTTIVKNENKNMNVGVHAGFAYNIAPRVMLMGNWAFLNYYNITYKRNIKTNPDSYDLVKYSGLSLDVYSQYSPFNMGFFYLINKPRT